MKGTLFTWKVHKDFGNLIFGYSRDSGDREKHGGGESGVMCCNFREEGKVERIFQFFCELHNLGLLSSILYRQTGIGNMELG